MGSTLLIVGTIALLLGLAVVLVRSSTPISGFVEDIGIAAELNMSDCAPMLSAGAYQCYV